jgi:hypothetical protein
MDYTIPMTLLGIELGMIIMLFLDICELGEKNESN